MELRVDNIAKRFVDQWIFRNLTVHIPGGKHTAVDGPNGAGKSTLLKIIAGALPPTEGKIGYLLGGRGIDHDDLFHHISFAAPYAELIEEFTLFEAWAFHKQFKRVMERVANAGDLYTALAYPFDGNIPMHSFSSGMKQRIRLAFALYTEVPLILLDEPTTNLDADGVAWFRDQLMACTGGRTVIIASNNADDLATCEMRITLQRQTYSVS